MSHQERTLLGEGFARLTTVPVGVPHHVWKAEVDIEFDRRLRLAEEAILNLLSANVTNPQVVAELLGLSGEPIVPRYIADMMIKGLITARDDQMVLTPQGRQAQLASSTREEKTYTVEFRHDPYRDEFRWSFDDEHKGNELEGAGLKPLPSPAALGHGDLIARHRDIQAMVERDGMPFDADAKKNEKRRREVLRLRPTKYYTAYRPAELEVWHRKESDEFRWRLLREGGDEEPVSRKLLEMQAEGISIVPVEDPKTYRVGEKDTVVQEAVRQAESVGAPMVLQTDDHRPALEAAIKEAEHELIIISPWLRVAAVDQELITWFRNGMDRHRSLRITIGYGIESDEAAGRRDARKARDQADAISRLRRLEQESRYRGRFRLVEIGNTHQKIVMVDERYAIVTSFNFLSFNPLPGKVLRHETGTRLIDPAAIRQLKTALLRILAQGPSVR